MHRRAEVLHVHRRRRRRAASTRTTPNVEPRVSGKRQRTLQARDGTRGDRRGRRRACRRGRRSAARQSAARAATGQARTAAAAVARLRRRDASRARRAGCLVDGEVPADLAVDLVLVLAARRRGTRRAWPSCPRRSCASGRRCRRRASSLPLFVITKCASQPRFASERLSTTLVVGDRDVDHEVVARGGRRRRERRGRGDRRAAAATTATTTRASSSSLPPSRTNKFTHRVAHKLSVYVNSGRPSARRPRHDAEPTTVGSHLVMFRSRRWR